MRVVVENVGVLDFPDGTDQAVIDQTVQNVTAGKKQSGFTREYLPSIPRTKDIYLQEERAGREAMGKALEEPGLKTAVDGFLGAMQYAFSPLTAVAKGIVREPIEQGMQSVGVPKGAAKFVGEMAETGVYLIPYGKAVQAAIRGKQAKEIGPAMRGVVKPKGQGTLTFPEELPAGVIEEAKAPISKAHKKVLHEGAVDDVISEMKQIGQEKWLSPSAKRITQEIVDYIAQNPSEVVKVAKKYNLTPQQLAAQMKETMTIAGRDLGRMGRLARDIRKKYQTPYMKQLSDYLEKEIADVPAMDKFGKVFQQMENIRRSALVSQVATTMRNIISQGGRVTLGAIDDAFQGAANAFLQSGGQKPFASVKSTLRGLGEGLDLITATINRMKPKERAKLAELLDSSNALQAKAKMFTTPIQDVALTSKVSKTLNTFNTAQEYFFRNIAFEAKLRQLARQAGVNLKKLGPDDIPETMFNEAAEYALDMTFAAMPKSRFAKDWVKAMSHPIMTALVNPFPRFLYGNALPFLKRFSPVGFLEAAKPSVVADIVSGNPQKFAKAISEATLGTIMLNTAAYLRNSEYRGEKWYQIKIGNRVFDLRAFAPFSTYLFIAEAMQSPDRIKPADYGQALLSLNRIGGTGLVLADIIRSKNVATTKDTMERLAGAYISGFTVPARTMKDLYSAVDPEEAAYRDVRDSELFGPALQNIPVLSQRFPKAKSPIKTQEVKAELPWLRQLSGISQRTVTELEAEVAEIQLDYSTIFPGTGDPEADRKMSEIIAPIVEEAFPLLKANTNYEQMDVITKRIVLGEMFKDAKKQARMVLMETAPSLAAKIKIDSLPLNIKQYLQSRNILPLEGSR